MGATNGGRGADVDFCREGFVEGLGLFVPASQA